jgi:hypothetical protein
VNLAREPVKKVRGREPVLRALAPVRVKKVLAPVEVVKGVLAAGKKARRYALLRYLIPPILDLLHPLQVE